MTPGSIKTRGERAIPVAWAGLSLLLAPGVNALEVGELVISSRLGQPLAASLPVRLAPGESLVDGCIRSTTGGGDLGEVPGATAIVPIAMGPTDATVRVTSGRALFEPVYTLTLRVDCPGTPVMVRQLVLMLDLPGTSAPVAGPETRLAELAPAAAPAVVATPTPSAPRPATTPARSMPLAGGVAYVVQPGDTLWGITRRLRDRDGSVWAAAEAIVAANPDAFVNGNPNRLRAGATLVLPATPVPLAAGDQVTPSPVTTTAPVTQWPADVAPPTAPVLPAPESPAPVAAPAVDAVEAAASSLASPIEPGEPVPAERPAATAAGADGERVLPAPTTSAGAIATGTDTGPVRREEPNPLFAALAGLAFGLVLSGILWSRRIRDVLRPRAAAGWDAYAGADQPGSGTGAVALAFGTRTPPEPAISVSFEASADALLEREFGAVPGPLPPLVAADRGEPAAADGRTPSDEITAELEELFNVPAGRAATGGGDATAIARPDRHAADDYLSNYPEPLDIGSLDDDPDATIASATTGELATVEQPRGYDPGETLEQDTSATGSIDLHALTRAAGGDGPHARTLREALSLLERDYEHELTASQILDAETVRATLAANGRGRDDRD